MKIETMTDPQEISQEIWFEEDTQVVIVNLDRISVAFTLNEFFDVMDRFEIARETLLSNFNIVVGTYEVDGAEKKETVLISEDDEYH